MMTSQIKPLTNYCRIRRLDLRSKQRKILVRRIQQLSTDQENNFQVFYSAVNIADHFHLSIAGKLKQAPCQETLAVACVLIAAKLEYSGTNT